ncbi:MAG: tRNA preQ1(34) S-adenosylmethionine ribosyltransferase-isomerase QueA [Anaerolineae bacterium]
MLTDAFDYDLPPELIAQEPIEPRDASRLLVLDRRHDALQHRWFRDILEYLRPGDLLVANETRVIPARLQARKVPSGGRVELLLLAKRGFATWEALVKGRRTAVGQWLELGDQSAGILRGQVEAETESGGRLIRFAEPVEPFLGNLGSVPLPPYIHTPLRQPERYQTVYARTEGSVAAPTAGLHFTPELLERTRQLGVEWATVLLHIGLDTFRPVTEERVEEHRIHTEYCLLSEDTAQRINRAKQEGRRVIAVGTTSVRVLESAARGVDCGVQPCDGPTDLFIYPGYTYRVVDALITNFHLPRSSLLMLVSAFAGLERTQGAYAEAIRQRYRFYSFGDSMLIL